MGSKIYDFPPRGYEQIDLSDGNAHSLTVPASAQRAVVNVEAADIRWRDDGTDPDATNAVGMLVLAGTTLTFDSDLSVIKFISAAAAVLNVSYY